MVTITKVYTRVEHDGLHIECNDTHGMNAKWRTCTNEKTTEHVPPSFTTGMSKADMVRLRDLLNNTLETVYDDYG